MLALPTQLEVKKHRAERSMRCELESLTVLKSRYGIQNPFLDYVVTRMIQKGIKLSPTSVDKKLLLQEAIVSELTDKLEEIITSTVVEFVNKLNFDGEQAVRVDLDEEEIEIEDLNTIIKEISSKMEESASWSYERDYETEAEGNVSERFKELME